jgi:hypothetical protein
MIMVCRAELEYVSATIPALPDTTSRAANEDHHDDMMTLALHFYQGL